MWSSRGGKTGSKNWRMRRSRLGDAARSWWATRARRRRPNAQSRRRSTSLDKLDILVNNAGVGIYGDLVKTSAEDYDTMMDSNMRSTFLFARHTAPVMIERGSGVIINIASMAGVMGFAGEAAYCATKFAQVGFTQALDRELRPRGIKVGAVCPGGVKTEFAIGTGRTEEGVAQSGMLEAEEVAAAALLMATQPAGARITEIRMRPMVEPLAGRDPE